MIVNNDISSKDISNYLLRLNIPVKGILAISGICNLRCQHCFVKSHWTNGYLDTELLLSFMQIARDFGSLFVTLTGGEPLLHPDFIKIYTRLHELGFNVGISTNATMLTPKIADCLKEYPPFTVNIGLYGIEASIYELVTGKQNSFSKFLAALDMLKERSIPFLLRALMLTTNKKDPKDIENFAAKWQAPVRFFTRITNGIDGDITPSFFRLPPEDMYNYLDINLKNHNKLSLLPPKTTEHSKTVKENEYQCMCGRTTFFVDCQGKMHPCQLSTDKGIDLRKFDFMSAWEKIRTERKQRIAISPPLDKLLKSDKSIDLCPPFVKLQGKSLDSEYFLLANSIHKRICAESEKNYPSSENNHSIEQSITYRVLHELISECSCTALDDHIWNEK